MKAATATPTTAAEEKASAAAVQGTWDWIFRSTTQQGDSRIEQEEWQLVPAGRSGPGGTPLRGDYLRQVLTLSSDQRPFRCNGRLGFLTQARVRLEGHVRGTTLTLREVSREATNERAAEPCASGEPPLTTYEGQLSGDTLRLLFRDGAVQHLVRRSPGRTVPALATEAEISGARPGTWPAHPGGLTGTWQWQHRSEAADGEVVLESEVWQLRESGPEITGSYERTQTRSRRDGTFRCNGRSEIRTVTRFTVRGLRTGDRLSLSELGSEATRGPCDTGQRRLDQYQGALLPDGTLLLGAGNGHQLLRRTP